VLNIQNTKRKINSKNIYYTNQVGFTAAKTFIHLHGKMSRVVVFNCWDDSLYKFQKYQ